jgi:hypothetical protein
LVGSSIEANSESFITTRRSNATLGSTQPTMLAVDDAIQRARLELRNHAFIQRLQRGASMEQLRSMARGLTFFVMTFQDVLRLARATTTERVLRGIAETHEAEDRGHDQWFLHDARCLGSSCDVQEIFSVEHAVVRDLCYALISEVLCAPSDQQRLSVVLCLEAAGGEFFDRVITVLESIGASEGLRYFARSHQTIEENHDVFDVEAQQRLLSIPIPSDVLESVLRSVERVFLSMTRLADELERRMAAYDRVRSVA